PHALFLCPLHGASLDSGLGPERHAGGEVGACAALHGPDGGAYGVAGTDPLRHLEAGPADRVGLRGVRSAGLVDAHTVPLGGAFRAGVGAGIAHVAIPSTVALCLDRSDAAAAG